MYLTTKNHFVGRGADKKFELVVGYKTYTIPHNCELVHDMTITSCTTQSQAVHITATTRAQAVYLTMILSTCGRSYFPEVESTGSPEEMV